MATLDLDDVNPYEAPRTATGAAVPAEVDAEAVAVRRQYLRHESAVRTLGLVGYVVGYCCLAGMFGVLSIVLGAAYVGKPIYSQDGVALAAGFGGLAVVGTLAAGLGRALRRLGNWSRWVVVVASWAALSLLAVTVLFTMLRGRDGRAVASQVGQTLIPVLIWGYVLSLVGSAKGSRIFSADYREVVRRTPQIRSRAGLLVRVLIGLLLTLVTITAIGSGMALVFRSR